MQEGEAIEHPWVTKAIENAQRKVEGRNFDIRKQLLEYDDVANDQRKVIYEQRRDLMDGDDVSETIASMREDVLSALIDRYIPPESLEEQWDIPGLSTALGDAFGGRWPIGKWLDDDESLHEESLRRRIAEELARDYSQKEQLIGAETMRQIEKTVMLQTLDAQWKDHLAQMDYLRQGIHLRGYAQRNPKQEYKREAFEMFSAMLASIRQEVVRTLSRLQVQLPEDQLPTLGSAAPPSASEFEFKHEVFRGLAGAEQARREVPADRRLAATRSQRSVAEGADVGNGAVVGNGPEAQPYVREGRKVGRNEPCPCGSGKKYKQCHGRMT